MTQEDRQLLLKDLCVRLPYNVVIRCTDDDTNYKCFLTTDILNELLHNIECYDYKPYLRPMSSMTEEEREEVQVFICDEWFFEDSGFATKVRKEGYIEFLANYDCSGIDPEFCGEYVDWLTAHHFDYRRLISMGLALEAPEGMYK